MFFLMAYKVKSVLSVYALVVFKVLFVFIAKKIKCQAFTCFFENTLLIFKILPVTLFKELVAAFRNQPVTVKLASEPGCDSENCSVNRP